MTRRTSTPPTTDPLADLRDLTPPEAPGAQGIITPLEDVDTTVDLIVPEVVYDRAWHEDAIGKVVQRWHDEWTLARIVHKGGSCPCHRLARLALLEAVGVALEPLTAPEPLEDQDDGNGAEDG